MPLPWPSPASIVQNLRLSLALLVIGLGLMCWLSAIQFRQIAQQSAALTGSAIPALTEAQQAAALVQDQIALTTALKDAAVTTDLSSFREATRRREDEINAAIGRFTEISQGQLAAPDPSALFQTTYQLIDQRAGQDALFQLQAMQREEVHARLVELLTAFQAQQSAIMRQLQDDLTEGESRANLKERMTALTTWTQMMGPLDAMQRALLSDAATPIGQDDALASQLLPLAEEVIRQMPPDAQSDTPRRLAEEVQQLSLLIKGPGGMHETAGALASLDAGLTELELAASAALAQSRVIANDLRAAGTRLADGHHATLRETMAEMAWFHLLIMLCGLTLVGIATVVVERRVNRRVRPLAAAARAFSRHHFDHPIDTSGRDELHDIAVALRAAQLTSLDVETSHNDMGALTYAATHDLQSPIRGIAELASWTLEDGGNALSDTTRKNLTQVQDSASHLSHLVDGLRAYAQVGSEAPDYGSVNLAQCVKDIMGQLDPAKQFQTEVHVDPGPFETAKAPLQQVLTQLLSNAIKFHDKGQGWIRVSAEVQDTVVVITVEDDGPGIPKAFHAKVFEMLQKLEAKDRVSGAGIGLALVRRLAERHGNGIRVETATAGGRGARFVFSLYVNRSDQVILTTDAA